MADASCSGRSVVATDDDRYVGGGLAGVAVVAPAFDRDRLDRRRIERLAQRTRSPASG